MHYRPITIAAVVLLLVAAGAGAGEPEPPSDRVAVLDAGTFVVVEVHQAQLGEVLAALGTRLGITLANTERVDLSRVVDGRRSGSLIGIIRWLVPDHSFVLLYEERRPDDPRPARVERVGFLNTGTERASGTAVAPPGAAGSPESAGRGAAVLVTPIPPVAGAGDRGANRAPAGGNGLGEDLRNDGSKPDLPSSPMSEIKSVAEQLRAATPAAQLQIERDARSDRAGAPPEFLRPQSDAAQTTLQQQAQRSQALAVEQLQALLEALKAACRSAKGGGPC